MKKINSRFSCQDTQNGVKCSETWFRTIIQIDVGACVEISKKSNVEIWQIELNTVGK